MIGDILGITMIVAGIILSGWGQWRLRRPIRFFAAMRRARTFEDALRRETRFWHWVRYGE